MASELLFTQYEYANKQNKNGPRGYGIDEHELGTGL